jgi:3-oxoacyl-[acyl-carrier protein] reductase
MIKIGKKFSTSVIISRNIIDEFSKFSGDYNPIHLDEKEAKKYGFNKPVAHGAIILSMISKLIGNEIPGPGALWLSQDINWLNPVFVDDRIEVTLKVIHFSKIHKIITLETTAFKDNKIQVMRGEAKVKISNVSKKKIVVVNKVEKKPIANKKKTQILITGGSGKLGWAIAEKLSKEGLNVVITYNKNKKNVLSLKKSINRKYKKNIEIIKLNLLGDYKKELVKISKLNIQGFIHCAINKIVEINPKDIDPDIFYKDWLFSCQSILNICKVILPNMIEKKFGRLIFLGTSAMDNDSPKGWSSYLMNKHALWGLTKSFSKELGPDGITSNMVSPSLILSDLTQDIPERVKELMAIKNPLGRLATPEDVANTVYFLTKKEAEYINGQNLFITGG